LYRETHQDCSPCPIQELPISTPVPKTKAPPSATCVAADKDAIISYISDIDCCSDYEDNPFVLGDTDFAHLFVQSLERRGKTSLAKWVPMIIHGAQVEHSPEVKQVLENLRKGLKRTLGS